MPEIILKTPEHRDRFERGRDPEGPFNEDDSAPFVPDPKWGQKWTKILATNESGFVEEGPRLEAGSQLLVESRSLWLLRRSDSGVSLKTND